MGKTLIRLAVSVLCNVVAIVVWLGGYLIHGQIGATLVPALVLVLMGLFIKPPTDEVDIALDALRHDAARR